MDVFNQPAVPGPRPAPLTLRKLVNPPLSPAAPDVTSSPRFIFPSQSSSSFPPVQELLELCEEELRTLTNREPVCTQPSPTHSYYADSESERSNINTPADERFFVFPDVPVTPDQRLHTSQSGAFSFDPEVINGSTQGVSFYWTVVCELVVACSEAADSLRRKLRARNSKRTSGIGGRDGNLQLDVDHCHHWPFAYLVLLSDIPLYGFAVVVSRQTSFGQSKIQGKPFFQFRKQTWEKNIFFQIRALKLYRILAINYARLKESI